MPIAYEKFIISRMLIVPVDLNFKYINLRFKILVSNKTALFVKNPCIDQNIKFKGEGQIKTDSKIHRQR